MPRQTDCCAVSISCAYHHHGCELLDIVSAIHKFLSHHIFKPSHPDKIMSLGSNVIHRPDELIRPAFQSIIAVIRDVCMLDEYQLT